MAADSEMLGLVMPETKVLIGVHVDRAKVSPFGQYVLTRMQRTDGEFERFVAATGFDPRRDVKEILVASTGEPGHQSSLVLARGAFDASRLTAAARLKGHTTETYKGVEILVSPGGNTAVAFLDSSLAAAGEPDKVRGAIDRRSSASAIAPGVAAKVNQLSGQYDGWMVTLVPVSTFATRLNDPNMQGALRGDLLRAIDEASGGVKFGQMVQISAQAVTRTEKDATALADVARFLATMVRLNVPERQATVLGPVLEGLDVKTEGNTLHVNLAMPESDLERLLESHGGRARRRGASLAPHPGERVYSQR